MKFTQMIETNEHEGESWCFWLQLDGNEEAIDWLIGLIEDEDKEEEYCFTGVEAEYYEVCILEEKGNFGYNYMSQHHKVEGKLIFPEDFEVDDIYKGSIDEFFKEGA